MYQIISPKITSFVFSILVLTFLAVFYAIAWTEPTQAPPNGNVAAPLNVSNTGQSKSGGLILNTGGAANGLVIDQGNLCLGADCRSSWPTRGNLTATSLSCRGDGSGFAFCTTSSCSSGYVLSGCSVETGGSGGTTFSKAAPSGNACSCSVSGLSNNAVVICYAYCISLSP